MPITVEEKYLSRPTKDSGQGDGTEELLSVELHYVVKGTDVRHNPVSTVETMMGVK